MPIKFLPYFPNTIQGQAILDNLTRTRRVLRYNGDDKATERIRRGMPLFETQTLESVGEAEKASQNLVLRGECLSACAFLKHQNLQIDLVYIDPPFASGADYAKKVYLRRHPEKAAQIAEAEAELEFDELRAFEEKMYGDIWNKEDYLNWMFENLTAIKAVMSDTASIYVHLDWHIGHYVKVMMDEIFGENNFINEIIWFYPGREMHVENKFNAKHDTLLFYGRTESAKVRMSEVAKPHDRAERLKSLRRKVHVDEEGKEWVWETRGQAAGQEPYLRSVDEIVANGHALNDVWTDIQFNRGNDPDRVDYATQKPEALLERIIKASSDEGMIVADFFGGSGVTAKVAHDLGRRFVHVDVGLNSVQTARDRLKGAGASFEVREVLDGVSLFRNPVQTMDKLKSLIVGLKNEDGLDKFWEGALDDSKLGMVPVYLPNLLDSSSKVLDVPLINRVLREALPDLPDETKRAIVYYVDIDDEKAVRDWIKENNPTLVEIELRDLKEVLDEVVLNDIVEFSVGHEGEVWTLVIQSLISDRLGQKIGEYNAKKSLAKTRKSLESAPETEETDADAPAPGAKWKPIEISDNGLELIEMVSLDCTNASGIWQSDAEIKIDKRGLVIENGVKTKKFWDATISAPKKPLRLKIRNIAGDESILAAT